MGTIHKPFIMSIEYFNNILSYLVTAMVFWLNLASHPVSHNFPIDMREPCARPGKI